MKKWHMEGILDKANNFQKKVVYKQGNQIFLCAGNYPLVEVRRRSSLWGCFRFFFNSDASQKLICRRS